MQPFDKILVATDFSAGAEVALDKALAIRHAYGSSLALIHVYTIPVPYGDVWVASPQFIADLQQAVRTEMDAIVASATERAKAMGATTVSITGTVVTGDPASVVVDRARSGHFDLVVVGTHGRTGLSHFFIGSVAERIVRTCPCPVLTVRASKPKTTPDVP